MLPYGKQTIEKDDIAAVVAALQSDWLTTGPKVAEFETAFAESCSQEFAIAVSSGTSALHAAMFAAEVGANDEVIVPAITFVATANSAIYMGAKPVFVDVDPNTLLIDANDVRKKITPRTKAIVAMDYAGQPCDYQALREIANEHGLTLIADACHSLGASVSQKPVGSLADFTCFSLHPIKQITAGEGGVVVTNNENAASAIRSFRNHGITTDFRQREKLASHVYGMETLGFNYRITDIQCALGLSQLNKLPRFTRRRNDIARFYRSLLAPNQTVSPLATNPDNNHAYHLFVVKWDSEISGISRDDAFQRLRDQGIGANVHYQPVYQHPFYVNRFGNQTGCCPNAESAYEQILSLPMFPKMVESDVRNIVSVLADISHSNQISKAA